MIIRSESTYLDFDKLSTLSCLAIPNWAERSVKSKKNWIPCLDLYNINKGKKKVEKADGEEFYNRGADGEEFRKLKRRLFN